MLTTRAIKSRACLLSKLLDYAITLQAGFSRSPIHQKLLCKVTRLPTYAGEVAKCGATFFNGEL
jgi:cystathionine beta-lyase family protein involved in aluminum resistance